MKDSITTQETTRQSPNKNKESGGRLGRKQKQRRPDPDRSLQALPDLVNIDRVHPSASVVRRLFASQIISIRNGRKWTRKRKEEYARRYTACCTTKKGASKRHRGWSWRPSLYEKEGRLIRRKGRTAEKKKATCILHHTRRRRRCTS